MKKDGLIPIAFADKDGWPAMGTFDYLNMRLNGYQFHLDLCAHKECWDQQKVKDVFDNWKAILPYHDPSALGATWQEAAQTLATKKTGMYLLGVVRHPAVHATRRCSPTSTSSRSRPWPMEGQDARRGADRRLHGCPRRAATTRPRSDLLAFIGTPEGQNAYAAVDSSNIADAQGRRHLQLHTR